MEINSKEYWDDRFSSGDWSSKGGETQTTMFARAQTALLPRVERGGTLLDFGCGLGDAMPVYRAALPGVRLFGVDHSKAAINMARQRYGRIATFANDLESLGARFDLIICSNVLEHVAEPVALTEHMLRFTNRQLVIVTPYLEAPLDREHVRQFDDHSLDQFKPAAVHVFKSPGWTEYGLSLVKNVYLRNVVNRLSGRSLRSRRMQVMYVIDAPLQDREHAADDKRHVA